MKTNIEIYATELTQISDKKTHCRATVRLQLEKLDFNGITTQEMINIIRRRFKYINDKGEFIVETTTTCLDSDIFDKQKGLYIAETKMQRNAYIKGAKMIIYLYKYLQTKFANQIKNIVSGCENAILDATTHIAELDYK